MTRSAHAKKPIEEFTSKLASLGYRLRQVSKNPQIYSINDELVNVRSRGKFRETLSGRQLWYDVSFSVLQRVKWVVYLASNADFFIMLPSSELNRFKDRMYHPKDKIGTGVFDIDWDSLLMILRHKEVDIGEYYHNLVDEEDYPKF